MKVVTFNIRRDCDGGTIQAFENRKPLIREKILAEKADLIGFQEVLPHMAQWLEEALTDYCVLSCGRGAEFDDEAVTIAFRRDRFHLLSYRTFWLSPTEDIPGSRYAEQSEFARVCSVATLQSRETGKCIALFNTHLDHVSESARRKGIRKILDAIEKCPYPAILTGDLNTFPGSAVAELIARSGLDLTDVTAHVGTTFHNYDDAAEKLDYICVSREWTCTSVCKWEDCRDGVYLSDHYPVCAELELAENGTKDE